MNDPMRARFENKLPPWCLSRDRFDFAPEFVEFVRVQLTRMEIWKDGATLLDAKSWINKWQFSQERLDKVHLYWDEFQTQTAQKKPNPVVERVQQAEEFSPERRAANLKKIGEIIRNRGKVTTDE